MSYKWPGIPNGDYSFDHGRAVWNKIINYLRRLSEKLDADIVDATADRRGMMTAADKAALDAIPDTYVKKTGDTVTGNINSLYGANGTDTVNQFSGEMAGDDLWAIRTGVTGVPDPSGAATGDNGFLEIATADNGTEPIYISQYEGDHVLPNSQGIRFHHLVRRAILLDEHGNTIFPGTVTAASFNGNATSANSATNANYATSAGTASKLGSVDVGSVTQPIYLDDGVPTACTYQLHKTVPADAVFTDTVYTHPSTSGNKHIPSGGSSGQILRWSADGTAVWGADTDTVYTHPTYAACTGKPTQDQTPAFGDVVTVSQIVTDATGHVTAANDKTITIPATEASQSAAGLMSATDKTKLDNLPAWSLASSSGRASGSMIYNSYLAMRGLDDTTVLTLAAAEDGNSSKGAKFYLYGVSAASRQGDFVIQAGSPTGYKQLIGKADGTLIWGGTSIVNQNAFANVKVGTTTIQADTVTDTIELVEGSNVTLTPDATNGKITIAATDTVTTVSTTGTGNAVTDISASDGALTVTKGASYLSVTGGRISGTIVFTGGNDIRSDTNDKQIIILGGSANSTSAGAKLILSGADYTDAGAFTLQTGNSTGYKQLIGKPDGTLTWNNHSLALFPHTSADIGQWQQVWATTSYSLPSGGTWAYMIVALNSSNDILGYWVNVKAGGTEIVNNSSAVRIYGFVWRVA